MKKILLLILSIIISTVILANEEKKDLASKITSVTVYQQGAQIERKTTFHAKQGIQELIIHGLPATIVENSLQASGKGNYRILGLTFQKDYQHETTLKPEVKKLKDSLDLLKNKKQEKKNLLEIFQKEEEILLANKKISGQNTGLKISELKSAMEYFRSQFQEIKDEQLKTEQELNKTNKAIKRIEQELQDIKGRNNRPKGEVHVRISSETDEKCELILNYVVMKAGWKPLYDLRAKDIGTPIELNYKATITQSTGNDWEELHLTISTGKANASNSQPNLRPQFLRFMGPPRTSQQKKPQVMSLRKEQEEAVSDAIMMEEAQKAQADMSTTQTRVEFRTKQKHNIPGNGKKYSVHLTQHELKAYYTYFAAPRLDNDAFLLAKVSDWEQYNFIPAKANLFFEGRYIGLSYFNTNTTEDTLTFSMGRDKSIIIKHEKIKDFESEKFIGKNKKISYERKIQVKNSKQKPINIVIKDQIPVSMNEDITVTPQNLSDAKHDKNKGFLKWKKHIQPKASEELTIKYTIEYPKDKKINY